MSRTTIKTITEQDKQEPDRLLMPQEVADQLAMSLGSLAQLRYLGRGPAFHKLSGKAVRYKQSDVTAWLESMKQETTRR